MNISSKEFQSKPYKFIEKYYYILLAVVLFTALFNLFYKLGDVPINSWDEARHGVNAYEMLKKNNYIVNTYAFRNDYWNLKPPVSYWAIIFGYRIFGYNALGLRFFSALASFITITAVCIFTLYKKGKAASIMSTTVLTTTVPFIAEHCARTGDADSIFVLFFTLSIISVMMVKKSMKWLYLSGLFFSMAFLTKSWHAGSLFIICGVYIIYVRKPLGIKKANIIGFFLSIAIPVFIWAAFRFHQDGLAFFNGMIGYDLAARTSRTLEGHVGTKFYYFETLQNWYFYWLLVFIGAVMGYLSDDEHTEGKYSNHFICLSLWIIVPFVLYTMAKTKIWWYILPIYPAAAVIIGITSDSLLKSYRKNNLFKLILIFLITIAVYKSEVTIVEKISEYKSDIAQELIKDTFKSKAFKGRHIYVDCYEQCYVLSAELYGDLVPCEGGRDGFFKDSSNSPLLVEPKDEKPFTGMEKSTLKLISENSEIYIFTK